MIEGWFVVCEDFHGVIGMFEDEEQAKTLAADATAESVGGTNCVYRAVKGSVSAISVLAKASRDTVPARSDLN